MYRYCIIFIFLCATVSVTNAQNLADSLFASGSYSKAAMEYERLIFNATSRDEVNLNIIKKARCQKAQKQYADAANTLQRTMLTPEILPELFTCLYLSEQYENATRLIEEYASENDTLETSLLLGYIFLLNEQYRYEESHKAATSLAETVQTTSGYDLKALVDSIYSKVPKQKSENTAQWLAFIPGLGHLYAGYPLEAFTALLINGAALGFGVWQVFEKCYVTAYLCGAGMLATTYPGNITSARKHVAKRNYKNNSQFNRMCKERLSAAYNNYCK